VSEWIDINGARIEKGFFEENVREAKRYTWTEIDSSKLDKHVHCLVCGIVIGDQTSEPEKLYKSSGGWLCSYCYQHFVK
jgi:hypothetical protein